MAPKAPPAKCSPPFVELDLILLTQGLDEQFVKL
jgi:hypothetical protein